MVRALRHVFIFYHQCYIVLTGAAEIYLYPVNSVKCSIFSWKVPYSEI